MKFRNHLTRGFLISLLILCSCAKKDASYLANAEFEEKYSKEVQLINSNRKEPIIDPVAEARKAIIEKRASAQFDDPATLLGINGGDKLSSARIDTSKFKITQPQNFTPNSQTFEEGQALVAKNKLPSDIFDLVYITETSPPFTISGLAFDKIEIPERDFFGVKSTLNDKQYLLAGNEALQKDIDYINDKRTDDDIELSQIIIREQRELRKKQKLNKIFADDSSIVEKEKIKEENIAKEENGARKKRLAEEDPLKKSIALQIVQQNLRQNAPADPNNPNGKNAPTAAK